MGEKERGQLESNLTFLLKAAYLSIKWLAMQRWNVLFSHWIKSLRQFPTWQLPQIPLTSLSVFLSFYPIAPLPLFLWKLLETWQKYGGFFQRARELSCIETERKSFTGVNVLICSKTIITMWHGRGLSVCAFGAYECVLSVFS